MDWKHCQLSLFSKWTRYISAKKTKWSGVFKLCFFYFIEKVKCLQWAENHNWRNKLPSTIWQFLLALNQIKHKPKGFRQLSIWLSSLANYFNLAYSPFQLEASPHLVKAAPGKSFYNYIYFLPIREAKCRLQIVSFCLTTDPTPKQVKSFFQFHWLVIKTFWQLALKKSQSSNTWDFGFLPNKKVIH